MGVSQRRESRRRSVPVNTLYAKRLPAPDTIEALSDIIHLTVSKALEDDVTMARMAS